MAKGPTFDIITAAFASASKLNANFTSIVTSFNNTISRDGSTPNQMTADLDLNGNDLLNVGNLTTGASSSVAFKGVRAYQGTTGTALTSPADVVLNFDTESFDTNNLHSILTNTSRLIADSDGYWVATGQMTMNGSTKEFEFIKLTIRLNGTTNIAEIAQLYEPSVSFDGKLSAQVTTDAFFLNANDYVELLGRIVPDDTTEVGEGLTWFTLRRVGV